MNLTKRERTIKYAVYCLFLLAAGLLQNAGGEWLRIGSAKCFFLIPVAVSLGIDEDEGVSAFLGFGAGLLWDAVALQHMGFNFIYLALVCYITSSMVSYLIRPTYMVTLLASVLATVLYCLLYWLFYVVIRGGDGALQSLGFYYIPCIIYTSAVSIVIAAVLRPVKKRLNKQVITD